MSLSKSASFDEDSLSRAGSSPGPSPRRRLATAAGSLATTAPALPSVPLALRSQSMGAEQTHAAGHSLELT